MSISINYLDLQQEPNDPLAKLFLELEREHGNDEVTKQATRALASTLRELELGAGSRLQVMLAAFLASVSAASPQPTAFVRVLQRVNAGTKNVSEQENVRKAALEIIEKQSQLQGQVLGKIAMNAAPLFTRAKTVFIRSYSQSVLAVLEGTAQNAHRPQVVLASQEKPKARKLISFLRDHQFSHIIIDEHALSHVISKIDFGLFGALALTGDGQLLLAPGVMALMAALRQCEKACYVALALDKIQLVSENQSQVHVEEMSRSYGDIMVNKRYFSHDIVPISLVTGIITERGILTPEEVLEFQQQGDLPD